MVRYFKVYFLSAFGSLVCIVFPWILAYWGSISYFDALDKYSFVSAIVALVTSGFYVLRHISEKKPRWIILILNPAVGYVVFLVYFMIVFSSTPWNGFSKLVP